MNEIICYNKECKYYNFPKDECMCETIEISDNGICATEEKK